jgi:HPt (histidine-containing phosphotransfer) domain-containing protein
VTEKIRLKVEPVLKELVPDFLANRRRDLERMRQALQAGDLAAIRDVGHNIRAFSRVYGFDDLTALGEQIRRAADESSTLRIVHLQGQLADYLSRLEVSD